MATAATAANRVRMRERLLFMGTPCLVHKTKQCFPDGWFPALPHTLILYTSLSMYRRASRKYARETVPVPHINMPVKSRIPSGQLAGRFAGPIPMCGLSPLSHTSLTQRAGCKKWVNSSGSQTVVIATLGDETVEPVTLRDKWQGAVKSLTHICDVGCVCFFRACS